MSKTFFDTETCGFHGPIVLLQYAVDDGPIYLYEPWCEPIRDTIDLLESFCDGCVVGFNLAFDWFHIQKMHNCLMLLGEKVGFDEEPRDHIDTFGMLEADARDGMCLKPTEALDLMLYARKGPYQSTMDRKDVRIKRVPVELAGPLAAELERRIPLDDIYFARKKKDLETRWKIHPSKNFQTGGEDPAFRDIVLKFYASSSLKALAKYALGRTDVILADDAMCGVQPIEFGWAPFATAATDVSSNWDIVLKSKKGQAWPGVIDHHIRHWRFHPRARRYAEDDVINTRDLYYHFKEPEANDDDSVLACLVGSNRWRGFSVDLDSLGKLRDAEIGKTKVAPRDPGRVFRWLCDVMSPMEKSIFEAEGSTKKVVLQGLTRWEADCCSDPKCPKCHGKGKKKHVVAERAEQILDSRKAYTKVVLFNKLIQAQRLHPSASVIGSLSSRMSGRTEVGDGKRAASLNALGIQHDKEIRKSFPLAFGDLTLCGGDFAAYEISIADAKYNDPVLRRELLTCYACQHAKRIDELDEVYCPNCKRATDFCLNCKRSCLVHRDGTAECCHNPKPVGKLEAPTRKIHGLFAMKLFPGKTYDEIQASKGTAFDMYDLGKKGILSQLYGGNEDTLVNRLDIEKELAVQANADFATEYAGVGASRLEIYNKFCSMRQPDGIGSAVVWAEPEEKILSLTGFPRYFTLENKICKALFQLAENPPPSWGRLKKRVVRRDREQFLGGAVRSAVFAAAFQIQAANMRAAANHEIQSTGAIITKRLQTKLWEHQPSGVHPWKIQLLNIHDELMAPCDEEIIPEVEREVKEFVHETRTLIPLLQIDWESRISTWADK